MDETDDPNRQGNSVTPAAGAGPVTPPGHDQYIDCVGVQPNIYLTHQFVQQHGTGITVMLDFNGVCYSPDATMLNQVGQISEVYTNSTIMTDGCASSACGSGGGGGGPATLDRWRLGIYQHGDGDPTIPRVDDIYLSETVSDTLGNFVNVNGVCYFLIASNEIGGVLTVPTTITALVDGTDEECDHCTPICVRGAGDTALNGEYTYDVEVGGWVHSLGLSVGVIHYDDDETVPRWEMQGTLSHHYLNAATNSNCPPSNGWTVEDGVAPVPTIDQGIECDAPTSCPTTGLVDSYRIAGYVNGQFAIDAAAGISAIDPPIVQWTGQVDQQITPCLWQIFPAINYAIDGSDVSQAAKLFVMTIILSSGKWLINIERNCTTGGTCSAGTVVVWVGEKITGQTPVGTYTRTAGFDTTATLNIEESP